MILRWVNLVYDFVLIDLSARFFLDPAAPCFTYEFGCFNGGCLGSHSYWCNGYPDCRDGSDETACPGKYWSTYNIIVYTLSA